MLVVFGATGNIDGAAAESADGAHVRTSAAPPRAFDDANQNWYGG